MIRYILAAALALILPATLNAQIFAKRAACKSGSCGQAAAAAVAGVAPDPTPAVEETPQAQAENVRKGPVKRHREHRQHRKQNK